MEALILMLLTNLPAMIAGATSAVESVKRIIAALKEHASQLTDEQRAQLDALEARLLEDLGDVNDVLVRD